MAVGRSAFFSFHRNEKIRARICQMGLKARDDKRVRYSQTERVIVKTLWLRGRVPASCSGGHKIKPRLGRGRQLSMSGGRAVSCPISSSPGWTYLINIYLNIVSGGNKRNNIHLLLCVFQNISIRSRFSNFSPQRLLCPEADFRDWIGLISSFSRAMTSSKRVATGPCS